ncbi:MAG: hypothetical protein L0215_23930 [Gemmataceae bacterium]|nr:hypothetical protein [Gemmataceae bacterium]
MLCRNCRRRRSNRPRRLCWRCYYKSGVREKHGPMLTSFSRRGPGQGHLPRRLPPFPTTALPGSAEKIAVLTQRAEMGLELFHPDDATEFSPGWFDLAG